MVKEIIYYTDKNLEGTELIKHCRKTVVDSGLPIITLSLRGEVPVGRNIVIHGYRSHTTLYQQILLGLLVSEAKYVFLCEQDILYHPSHFEFTPPTSDKYYYNNHVYKYRLSDRKVIRYDCHWLSQLCADRELLIDHFIKRFKIIAGGGKAYGYEPGTGQSKIIDSTRFGLWESEGPNIDVRHGKNWTGVDRMHPDEFRNKKTCQNWREYEVKDIPYWDADLLLSL